MVQMSYMYLRTQGRRLVDCQKQYPCLMEFSFTLCCAICWMFVFWSWRVIVTNSTVDNSVLFAAFVILGCTCLALYCFFDVVRSPIGPWRSSKFTVGRCSRDRQSP